MQLATELVTSAIILSVIGYPKRYHLWVYFVEPEALHKMSISLGGVSGGICGSNRKRAADTDRVRHGQNSSVLEIFS